MLRLEKTTSLLEVKSRDDDIDTASDRGRKGSESANIHGTLDSNLEVSEGYRRAHRAR